MKEGVSIPSLSIATSRRLICACRQRSLQVSVNSSFICGMLYRTRNGSSVILSSGLTYKKNSSEYWKQTRILSTCLWASGTTIKVASALGSSRYNVSGISVPESFFRKKAIVFASRSSFSRWGTSLRFKTAFEVRRKVCKRFCSAMDNSMRAATKLIRADRSVICRLSFGIWLRQRRSSRSRICL